MAIRIGINGFGRIGRQVFKAIYSEYNDEVDVVGVVEQDVDGAAVEVVDVAQIDA